MLERVILITTAMAVVPRARAGIIRYKIPCQKAAGYGGDGCIRADSPREREELQVHAEDHHQDHRKPEDRHAYPREREDGGDLVEQRVLLDRGDHPYGHANEHGYEHGKGRELEGGRQPHEEFRRNRTPGYDGVTEVAASRIFEEEAVLDEDRLVQSHLGREGLDLLLGGVLPQEYLGGIPGDGTDHKEHHDRHPEQYRDNL
jgi:hypothetical protein